jgi:hypothetical protein
VNAEIRSRNVSLPQHTNRGINLSATFCDVSVAIGGVVYVTDMTVRSDDGGSLEHAERDAFTEKRRRYAHVLAGKPYVLVPLYFTPMGCPGLKTF